MRHVAAVALCALVAHTAAYGSLMPEDGAHGYFTWYAPLVGVLSALSIVITLLAVPIALLSSPTSRLGVVVSSLLPTRSADRSVSAELFRLSTAALVFLAVQESLERSFSAGRPELASFASSTLVLLVATVFVAAAALALLERVLTTLTDFVLGTTNVGCRKPVRQGQRPVDLAPRARLRPLASHGGLRAPPLLA